MDHRLIDYYNDELQHLRREVGEFAAEFKDAAPMLSLDKARVEDPYVERLLEGVAYLAARVRLKLDAQYPVFTQQLMEVLFPGWLSPTPPGCIFRFNPANADDKLASGPVIKRGTVVRGSLRGAAGIRCEFETTRALQLFPLNIASIKYTAASPDRAVGYDGDAESSLRIELTTVGEAKIEHLQSMDRLPFYVTLPEPHGSQLLELIAGRCVRVGVSASELGRGDVRWLPGSVVRHLGLDADDAMFPNPTRNHTAFRLLREYAAFPEKFRFFEIAGLNAVLKGLRGDRFYLHLHFSSGQRKLESVVRADSLSLFCTPAVNLRERDLDRIDIGPGQTEYQIIGDRTSVRRYEVVHLLDVRGGGAGFERPFQPVFEIANTGRLATASYYTLRRVRRRLTEAEQRERLARLQSTAGYSSFKEMDAVSDTGRGSELFISLAEPGAGPQGQDLQYLSVKALCMEREVPTLLRNQANLARYECTATLPVAGVECLAGPSDPVDHAVDGFDPWLMLSHLQVNYLSLQELDNTKAAEALRSMLTLFAPSEAHALHRQAKSLLEVETEFVTRRLVRKGMPAFARGLQVKLTVSDRGFDGGSPFVLGALLDHFLATHVSVNSFVETTLRMKDWSKELRWHRNPGERPTF